MRQPACAMLLTILLATLSAAAGTDVWVETPGTMILADRPAGNVKAIDASGVRNEFVAAQIALRGETAADKPLSFEWEELKGPGKPIAKANVQIYRAADIEVFAGIKDMEIISETKDHSRARQTGMFPDALVPLVMADGTNVANTIALEKDKTAAFWVDIFIPAGTAPGNYTGTISLKQGQTQVAQIPVKLKVYDVEIPADCSIPSLYNLRLHDHVRKNMDAYVAEIMRHRIQPTNYHYVDSGDGWTVMDKCNPNGKGFVNVYFSNTKTTPEQAEKLVKRLKDVTEHLQQRGLMDRSFLHLKDEPRDAEDIAAMAELGKLFLKEVPQWQGKLADTLNREGNALDDLLTHHIRALKCYGDWYYGANRYAGREAWDKRRAAGQQLWFYVSNAQGVPYPTFDIHTVNLGFEPRVLGWAFWYEKAYGHLYWDLMFQPVWKLGKGFPPGDGQLIYPGDFSMAGAPAWVQVKDLKAPVISRRMKLQREGIEEWEMLRLAEKKVGREKVQAIVDTVYTSLGENGSKYRPDKPTWSYDESAWDKARTKVIELLLPAK